MNTKNSEVEKSWNECVSAYLQYLKARVNFFEATTSDQRISLLKERLFSIDGRSPLTWEIIRLLGQDELKQMLPELLALASYSHRETIYARDLIVSLPRDWLVANIESYAERILSRPQVTYEEYRGLLGVYILIDPDLTRRLATRALASHDPDIREAGEDFLEKLEAKD